MRRWLLAATLLAGCAPAPGTEAISYDRSAGGMCIDASCAAWSVVVRPNGRGTFDGAPALPVQHASFRATPAQVRAFAERLAPYRPSGERIMIRAGPECATFAWDERTYDIRWSGGAHLVFDAGCDPDRNAAMAAALYAAADVLPIGRFTGAPGHAR